MSEVVFDAQVFGTQVARGMVLQGVRRVIIQVIITFSNVILARLLTPGDFGTFAIISYLVMTVGLLGNFGLGQAIVQQQKSLTKKQLQSIFVLLVVAAVLFGILMYFLAPFINVLYKGALGGTGVFWLRVFAWILAFNYISTAATFLLQRALVFHKLVVGEILIVFVAQLITIIAALSHFGVGSFVIGALAGETVGLLYFFIVSRWPVGIAFSYKAIKPLLSFGMNVQANNLFTILQTTIVPGLVGVVSGPAAVGLVNWSAGVRQAGLSSFEFIDRLIFPAASRIQDKKQLLGAMLAKMLRLSALLSFPILALLLATAPFVVKFIYSEKWLVGLPVLYISLSMGFFVIFNTFAMDTLLALGHAKQARNISFIWLLLNWVFGIVGIYTFGYIGVVFAQLLVSMTFFIPLYFVKKQVPIKILPNIAPYLGLSLLIGVVVYLFMRVMPPKNIIQLIGIETGGLIAYFGLVYGVKQELLRADIAHFIRLLKLPK
ncbi:hypothetical protein C4579_02610 [Candidatus Microgenomates bacterium]|nr:MAG: hypothetical protein C4579_02610 [Candidatus Microgenomates bacterium]